MLRNRSSPRRKARSRVIGSPRYRRTAYSVMEPVTMLTGIAEMTNVAAPERSGSPESTGGRRGAGPAVQADRVRRGVRGPAGGTRHRGGQARFLRRASGREVVESCGGWPTSGHVISSENRAGSFIRNRRNFAYSPRESMDINQLGLVLMGTVLGWFLLFAVRRYKVQWGAFAAFMAIVFGVSMMSFLYARDLLAYYGIGIFIGFVSNMIVRVAGTTAGGKLGEGLLEISAFERKG